MSSLIVKNLEIDFPEYKISTDDFEVKPAEFLSVIAPSGFGKTTLLRGLLGFQKLKSGLITLNGRSLEDLPTHKRNFGVVFQDHLLFPNVNAFQNAVFGVKLRNRLTHGAILRAKAAFEALGLTSRMNAAITELSGGERQRVALLRATLFDPECLILDEPLKGLDAVATAQVTSYLQEHVRVNPVPVLWVSHQNTDSLPGGRIIGTERTGRRHFEFDRK